MRSQCITKDLHLHLMFASFAFPQICPYSFVLALKHRMRGMVLRGKEIMFYNTIDFVMLFGSPSQLFAVGLKLEPH